MHYELFTIFASILWVAKSCPPHGRHISESVSALSFNGKFRQNLETKDEQYKRSCLSHIHSRQGARDIRYRRGSGLFISFRAFGDASIKIN